MTKKPEISKPVHPPYALFGDVFVFPNEAAKRKWQNEHSSPQDRDVFEGPDLAVYDPKVHEGHLTCPCCGKASLKLVNGAFVTEKGSRHARTCEYAVAAKPLSLSGQHSILYNPRYPPDSLATRFNGPLICIGEGAPEPWLGIFKKKPSNHSSFENGKALLCAILTAQKQSALQISWVFNSGKAIRADKMILNLTGQASEFQKNNLTDLFNALNAGDSYPVVIRAAVPPQHAQRESEYYDEQVLTFPTFTTDPVTTIQFLDRESVSDLRANACQEFYAVAYPVLSADKKSISFVVAAKRDICQIIAADACPA